MSLSVLDYYVSVRHKKSVNFIYAFYHLLICYGKYSVHHNFIFFRYSFYNKHIMQPKQCLWICSSARCKVSLH